MSTPPIGRDDRTAQQLVRYEALFALLDEIGTSDDLEQVASASATRWKYIASACAARLVVPAGDGEHLVIDAARGSGTVARVGTLDAWDRARWDAGRPERFSAPSSSDEPPPPEHLVARGVTEVVSLPVVRHGRTTGTVALAARHAPFSDVDLRFVTLLGRHLVERVVTLVERRAVTDALVDRATRDPMTGLLNRGAVMDLLADALADRAPDEPLAVVLADLDHFKSVNDTRGHLAGDAVLREVATRIGAAARAGDPVGRFGGEEFLVVLRRCTAQEALLTAERLRGRVRDRPVVLADGTLVTVTLSLGVAAVGQGVCGLDDLVAAADRALYRAKADGRDRSAPAD